MVVGAVSLFLILVAIIQDFQLEQAIPVDRTTVQVSESECSQPIPNQLAICAQSIDWWAPVDNHNGLDCDGGQCYTPFWLLEMERYLTPILVPGWLPLVFIVIRKIVKARRSLASLEQ